MPKPLQADREIVKQLFIQGLKTSEIAAKTGVNQKTLNTWRTRYGWTQIASKTQALLTQPMLAVSLAEQSIKARDSLAKELAESSEQLNETRRTKGLIHLAQRAEVAAKLTTASGKVFGWDAESAPSVVNMTLLKNDPDLK